MSDHAHPASGAEAPGQLPIRDVVLPTGDAPVARRLPGVHDSHDANKLIVKLLGGEPGSLALGKRPKDRIMVEIVEKSRPIHPRIEVLTKPTKVSKGAPPDKTIAPDRTFDKYDPVSRRKSSKGYLGSKAQPR